jgi:hypothetical protein
VRSAADFDRSQFHRHLALRGGALFDLVRDKFHHQPEARERCAKFRRHMLTGGRALGGVETFERSSHVPETREFRKGFAHPADPPDEMIAAAGHQFQRMNAEGRQHLARGRHDGRLEREDAFLIQECIRGIIEIDVLEIEMRDQRGAIPERAVQLGAAIQPTRQLFDRQRFAVMRAVLSSCSKIDRAVSFRTRIPKELMDARPDILIAAIRTPIFQRKAHKMRSIEVVIFVLLCNSE